jgi:hypothetical protein
MMLVIATISCIFLKIELTNNVIEVMSVEKDEYTSVVDVQTLDAEEHKNEAQETEIEEEKIKIVTPEQCLGCQFDILPVEFTNVMPWVCECCGLNICAKCRYSEPHSINVKCGFLQKRE